MSQSRPTFPPTFSFPLPLKKRTVIKNVAILIFFHIFRGSFLKKNLDNDWSISLKILKIPWAFENPVGFSRDGTGRDTGSCLPCL